MGKNMKKTVLIILFVLAIGGAVGGLLAEHGYFIIALLQPPEIRDFEAILAKGRPAEDSPERVLSRQMAKKFKARYQNLKFLSFDAELYEVPAYKMVKAKVTMRPGFYTTKAWFDGQLVWELMFKDGKAYEHKLPYRGVVDQRITYPVKESDGPGEIRLSDSIPFHMGCMIGAFLEVWTGPDSPKNALITQRLRDGWYLRKEKVDGVVCLVFVYIRPIYTYAIEYYIDENYLLRKRKMYKWSKMICFNQSETFCRFG